MRKVFNDEANLHQYLEQSKKDGVTQFVSIEIRPWYDPMRWIKGRFYYMAR